MIKNKAESDYEIKKRDLNRMAEAVFTKDERQKLIGFLSEYNFPYYNMRDKSRPSGQFLYKLTKEEVLLHSRDYEKYSVYESLCVADEKLVLQGDIHINDGFEMLASLDDRKGISLREATKNPKYQIQIDLKEKREPCIKGLTEAIDYIVKHELFNCYVELSVYDIPVGIKKEKILVWEMRNY